MTWNELPEGARGCLERLNGAGHRAYPVGGWVRDRLMGREGGDVDVCTSALPEQVMELFETAVPTGLRHGTVSVPTGEGMVEITTFRREEGYTDARHPDAVRFDAGLEEDLSRRDFTINAMALDRDGTVIDPFGGRADLERGVVRCVGDPDRRFTEDALRILRAVRFSAQLGFRLEEGTLAALKRKAGRVEKVSRERIRAEMEKILCSPRPQTMGLILDCGGLDFLYPFPRGADLRGLAGLPAEAEARWRAFCAATGFPISCLPVERKLRRAVEHPELELMGTLALKPRELMELGLKGPEISAAQRKMALHVLDHPEDNEEEKLRQLLGI